MVQIKGAVEPPPFSDNYNIRTKICPCFFLIKQKIDLSAIFLLILNQHEVRLIENQKECCPYNHYQFNLARNRKHFLACGPPGSIRLEPYLKFYKFYNFQACSRPRGSQSLGSIDAKLKAPRYLPNITAM